jgi:hypothetical protein
MILIITALKPQFVVQLSDRKSTTKKNTKKAGPNNRRTERQPGSPELM